MFIICLQLQGFKNRENQLYSGRGRTKCSLYECTSKPKTPQILFTARNYYKKGKRHNMKKQKINMQLYKETPTQRLNRVRMEGNAYRPRRTPSKAELLERERRKDKMNKNRVEFD